MTILSLMTRTENRMTMLVPWEVARPLAEPRVDPWFPEHAPEDEIQEDLDNHHNRPRLNLPRAREDRLCLGKSISPGMNWKTKPMPMSLRILSFTDKQIVDPYGETGVYTGALSKSTGMPNGKGRLEYEKEGRWYEGDWIHGRWTGYGRLSDGDGDFYEGRFKNGRIHGTGVMRFADGRVFEGHYLRGKMITGLMTYQDGSIYGGSWVDGMRHGRGKCTFFDGAEYEGEFQAGNFHGFGQMTWNDGGWYVGEWSDGEMHGRGKEIRPDGSLRHDGEWARGQPIRSSNDSRRRRQQQPSQQQPPQGELAVK
jgi:hypothetical protein